MDHKAPAQTLAAAEWTPEELYARLVRGEPFFLLDLRNREEFAAWRIEGRTALPTLNVPYVEILAEVEDDDLAAAAAQYAQQHWQDQLPRDKTILAVCGKGNASAYVAEGLRRLGYRAVNLQGGMGAWGNYYAVRTVAQEPDLTIYQVIRPARGCLSYVVASAGEAAVVDPLRHIDHYVDLIRSQNLRAVAVLDTHGHADHISGGRALADALGAPYYLHAYDAIHPIDVLPAAIAYRPIWDGDQVRVGRTAIEAIHIPGHTLGNLVFRVGGRYLLTGDSIFIESIARPDLGGRGEAWSPIHYRSLRRLLELPDSTVILPGHFSSLAEAGPDGQFAGTLGELRTRNEGLRMVAAGEEAFVRFILSSLPTFPPQYVDIKRVNAGLLRPDEEKASELELGRNICALAQAYGKEG